MTKHFLNHIARAIQLRTSLYKEIRYAKKHRNKVPSGIIKKIWRDPHIHEEYIWLLRFIGTDEQVTLIDIGGNSGYWAEEFLRYYPKADVFAFEPVQEMYDQYANRFAGKKNISVYPTALGDTIEQRNINVAHGYGLTSFNTYSENLEERNQNFIKQLSVPIDRLDNYSSKINFSGSEKMIIKVDVQGFESKVVRGGLNIFKNADLAVIECSFINEFKGEMPTFGELVSMLRELDLHPVRFGVFDRKKGPIAYERNVLFVRSNNFSKVWDQ